MPRVLASPPTIPGAPGIAVGILGHAAVVSETPFRGHAPADDCRWNVVLGLPRIMRRLAGSGPRRLRRNHQVPAPAAHHGGIRSGFGRLQPGPRHMAPLIESHRGTPRSTFILTCWE